jgi:hypothetical protein
LYRIIGADICGEAPHVLWPEEASATEIMIPPTDESWKLFLSGRTPLLSPTFPEKNRKSPVLGFHFLDIFGIISSRYCSFLVFLPMFHRLHSTLCRGDSHGKRCFDPRKTVAPA